MRIHNIKAILKAATLAVVSVLLTAGASYAQSVSLTAGPATTTLPDGTTVPMWGYSCGAVTASATCTPLNLNAAGNWTPVVITVPSTPGTLTINLTNSLTFGANSVPTSLVIVGQLGGGLGDPSLRTTTAPPDHSIAQQVTWPIAAPGAAANTPPVQGPRVQSFSTEVAAGTTTPLTWSGLQPGTYLIESGTHAPIHPGTHGFVWDPGGHHRAFEHRPRRCVWKWTHRCEIQCGSPADVQ